MGCIRGAGEGNRTLVISLEGFCSTIELHPPSVSKKDSFTTCFVRPPGRLATGGGGWIRTNVGARPTDLQSAPFSRSGTPPAEPEIMWIIRRLVKKKRQSSGPVPHARAERFDRRERAVAREPGSLRVLRRRHVFEHHGHAAGSAGHTDRVGIQRQGRIGNDLELRPVHTNPGE